MEEGLRAAQALAGLQKEILSELRTPTTYRVVGKDRAQNILLWKLPRHEMMNSK